MRSHGGRIKSLRAWPLLQMSQHRYQEVSILPRASFLNSNWAWCDSSLAGAVGPPPQQGLDGKVAIAGHLSNMDDRQVPGTSLENTQRLQQIFSLSVATDRLTAAWGAKPCFFGYLSLFSLRPITCGVVNQRVQRLSEGRGGNCQ